MNKRITIKDIARECGLSVGAVSQALRPTAGSTIKVTDQTRNRVQEAAKRLNYRLHTGARSIRVNRFYNLGMFISKGRDIQIPQGYIEGVHHGALSHGSRLSIIWLPEDPKLAAEKLPAMFQEHAIDALIIMSYDDYSAKIHRAIEELNYPVVYLNDRHKENAVYVDDLAGSELMTRHLIECGYQSIQMLQRKPMESPRLTDLHYSHSARLEGYKNAMLESGLPLEICILNSEKLATPLQAVNLEEVFASQKPEAIFAFDDSLASALAQALYRKRIFIPEDIGLAGYNDDFLAKASFQPLTTVKIPTFEMGTCAVDMAMKLVNQPELKKLPSVKLQPNLVIRKTTKSRSG